MKISMLGAGSGFVMSVAKELIAHEIFNGCEFVLQDVNPERLQAAENVVSGVLKSYKNIKVSLKATTSRKTALDGCDYVITSCEMNRFLESVKEFVKKLN